MSQRQILFDDRRLVIDQQLQRIKNSSGVWENRLTLPKGGKKRTIALPQAISFVLRRHIEEYPPEDDEWGGLLFRGAGERLCAAPTSTTSAGDLHSSGLGWPRTGSSSTRCVTSRPAPCWPTSPITAVAAHLGDTVRRCSGRTPTGSERKRTCPPRCSIGCSLR